MLNCPRLLLLLATAAPALMIGQTAGQAAQTAQTKPVATPVPMAGKSTALPAYHVFRVESLSLGEANLDADTTAPESSFGEPSSVSPEFGKLPPSLELSEDSVSEAPTAGQPSAGEAGSPDTPDPTRIAAPSASARQATAVFHVDAKVVLIDVVITDNKGNAIHDLERGRFHIFEDGREQHISYFDETKPAVSPSSAQLDCLRQTSPGVVSNVPCVPSSGAVNVLLLDALNTPVINQADINRQVLKYLGRAQPGTTLAVFILNGHGHLQMLSGFTTDAAQLTRAVQSKAAAPSTSVALEDGQAATLRSSADQQMSLAVNTHVAQNLRQTATDIVAQDSGQQVQLSLLALRQLALYLDSIPGRKNLIWFSGSFPITLEPDPMTFNPTLQQSTFKDASEHGEELHDTIRLLSVARVAVYPVYALGPMSTPSIDASYNMPGKQGLGGIESGMDDERTMGQSLANQDSMKQLADQTGGHYFQTNGLGEAMASAVKNGASFYTIGYIPTAGQQKAQYHALKLRLDGATYTLSYRRGYMTDPQGTSSGRSNTRAMQSSVLVGAPPATQIQFQARVLPSTDPMFQSAKLPAGGGSVMATGLVGPVQQFIVDLAIDPQGLAFEPTPEGLYRTPLEFAIIAYDADGKRVNYLDQGILLSLKSGQYARMLAENTRIPHRVAFDLPAGTFNMRIVVMDPAKNRIGSVELPVHFPTK
jgi:VWFA-related protein